MKKPLVGLENGRPIQQAMESIQPQDRRNGRFSGIYFFGRAFAAAAAFDAQVSVEDPEMDIPEKDNETPETKRSGSGDGAALLRAGPFPLFTNFIKIPLPTVRKKTILCLERKPFAER